MWSQVLFFSLIFCIVCSVCSGPSSPLARVLEAVREESASLHIKWPYFLTESELRADRKSRLWGRSDGESHLSEGAFFASPSECRLEIDLHFWFLALMERGEASAGPFDFLQERLFSPLSFDQEIVPESVSKEIGNCRRRNPFVFVYVVLLICSALISILFWFLLACSFLFSFLFYYFFLFFTFISLFLFLLTLNFLVF